MANESIADILRTLEMGAREAVAHSEGAYIEKIVSEQRRIETLLGQESKRASLIIQDEHSEKIQLTLMDTLVKSAHGIVHRSAQYEAGNLVKTPDILEISFVYGRIGNEPNQVGIVLPAERIATEGSSEYGPTRLKALALEVLLQSHSTVGISEIRSLPESTYTCFLIEFNDTLDPAEEGLLTTSYIQTMQLEERFQRAIKEDPVFSHMGIVFQTYDGTTLTRLDIANFSQTPDEFQAEVSEYISLDETVDMLFGIEKGTGYQGRHEQALFRFRQETSYGTFNDEFNDFDKRDTAGGDTFRRDKIIEMINGQIEEVPSSAGTIKVHKHYIVQNLDHEELCRVFSVGAYTFEDALKKYDVLTSRRIKRNFGPEGDNSKPYNYHEFEQPDGSTLTLYAREDLEDLASK